MKLRSRHSFGFRVMPLYRRKHASIVQYLSRKFAFWTAMFSLFAFVVGNQVGQYGINVFLHSVFGDVDNSLITYDGTVSPLKVPDYTCWKPTSTAALTYADVPKSCLRDLPKYDVSEQRAGSLAWVYSIGHMGSYATGHDGEGSHAGVDVRAPKGTPIVSVMKGLVVRSTEEPGGFGLYVTIKTANAPDPSNPSKTTTIYTTYAHMSAKLVEEGVIVEKGQKIGEVGATGFAAGNHLHFQMNREAERNGIVLAQPAWPFTSSEARDAGLSFSQAVDAGLHQERAKFEQVSPIAYVQSHYASVDKVVAKNEPVKPVVRRISASQRRDARVSARVARNTVASHSAADPEPTVIAYNDEVAVPVAAVVPETAPVPAPLPPVKQSSTFATVEMHTDGLPAARREWKTVTLIFLDENGNRVASPTLKTDIYLRTAFGKAEFKPARLSELDIVNGTATVQVLGFSPTVVLQLQPLGTVFDRTPLQFEQ